MHIIKSAFNFATTCFCLILLVSVSTCLAKSLEPSVSQPNWVSKPNTGYSDDAVIVVASALIVDCRFGVAREQALLLALQELTKLVNVDVLNQTVSNANMQCRQGHGNSCSNTSTIGFEDVQKQRLGNLAWRQIGFWHDTASKQIYVRIIADSIVL